MSNLLVSVIMPLYNAEKYVAEAIQSVINQTHQNWELIIVNDGSNDNSFKIAESFKNDKIKVFSQENAGPASARNTAIKTSKGEYLLFLDSDNKITPICIEKGLELFEKNSEIDIVYGNPHFFGDSSKRIFWPHDFVLNKIIDGNYIDMCSIIRLKVWEKLNGFDEERVLIGHEDWEFWIRAGLQNFKFHYENEIWFEYRVRDDSLINSINEQKFKNALMYIYSKHIALFLDSYNYLKTQKQFYEFDKKNPFRAFVKYLYLKFR